jgi:hypothetical protein
MFFLSALPDGSLLNKTPLVAFGKAEQGEQSRMF